MNGHLRLIDWPQLRVQLVVDPIPVPVGQAA
jgi:hypothetical protein